VARILITGINGQIGSYVTDLLLEQGHEVVGLANTTAEPLPASVRRAEGSLAADGIDDLLTRNGSLSAVIHLAGLSSVSQSWQDPVGAFDANGRNTAALAFAIAARGGPRLVNASSAEIFGRAPSPVQDERTPISPVSPYGVSKAAGHLAVTVGREGFGAPLSNLILYPGESERRAKAFVFRRITSGVAAIQMGRASELVLGDLSIVRDFSHASDLARAAAVLALGTAVGDYVCGSGEGHSIGEVAATACDLAAVPVSSVRSDPARYRPNDIPSLVADNTRLRALGWKPQVTFRQLVQRVLQFDLGGTS
jgi:GDPmannose 4,6-dehydratase